MHYSTLSTLLFVAFTSGAAISSIPKDSKAKRDVGCYNVHNNPDWMKYDVFNSGINTVCDSLEGLEIGPGSNLLITVPGLKLEDGRDGEFVGSLENTGSDSYRVDYNYCSGRMGAIRDQCSGSSDQTYGGEWHDVIWVRADTNAV
ncbi:hypothetical protein BDW59DRAFT_164738 [Aspergillus cavernicola]|uniref:Uncharacterized protein n=1 Tax=Aspergillus cavernicola TaxID=176166 RepID=A0ABR4HXM4_9EURO